MSVNNSHGMLDIETAGTGVKAHILTIGFLQFDPLGDGSEDVGHHFVVGPRYNTGRELDFDTLKWWMQQNESARSQAWLATATPSVEMFSVLEQVFITTEHLWANDPDFDCSIVKDWFTTYRDFKWPFWKHRSIRTLKALYSIPPLPPMGIAHNALDDCRYQAQIVRAVYQGKAPPALISY